MGRILKQNSTQPKPREPSDSPLPEISPSPPPPNSSFHYQWDEPGREFLQVSLEIKGGEMGSVKMRARGCLSFLRLCQKMKLQLSGPLERLRVPQGTQPWDQIWQEMVLRIQDQWEWPLPPEELLCNCRRVSVQTVDRAIVYGARSVGEVREKTSANTGCGTCLKSVELLINHRLAMIP